jgi:hypothetical protein
VGWGTPIHIDGPGILDGRLFSLATSSPSSGESSPLVATMNNSTLRLLLATVSSHIHICAVDSIEMETHGELDTAYLDDMQTHFPTSETTTCVAF